MRASNGWLVALLLAACVGAPRAITVERLQMNFEQEYTLEVTNMTEYILEYTPVGVQRQLPARVRLRVSAGEAARPVLVTARQQTGAQTWQLPYYSEDGSRLLLDMQRTLCANVSATQPMGAFSLHVASATAAPAQFSVLAEPSADWHLLRDTPTDLTATLTAPKLQYYSWSEDEERVLLTFGSEDNVCARIAVQNYSCPLPETLETLAGTLRMTVQRSGGITLARSSFTHGFLIALVVLGSDELCEGEELTDEPSWLWEAAAAGAIRDDEAVAATRTKTFTLTVQSSLSRGQYAIATSATLLLFLAFYAAFVALVLAQRYSPLKPFVAPKAVLAKDSAFVGESMADTAADRRRRRDSDATFDSVDDDSESDEELPAGARTAADNAAFSADGAAPTAAGPGSGSGAAASTPEAGTANTSPAANSPTVIAPPPTFADGQGPNLPQAAPFGLPPQLRVAALARRGARTLRARSDRYLQTLYIVAVFYALPVLQFVAAFQIVLNVSGSLDLCYYNFLCAHPLGLVSDFNHIFSNAGYLLLGALFILQVKRRRRRRRRKPRDEEYGIPAHYGLLEALGAGMMVVALLSASYHVCPNGLNFQFDTAFMYVLAVLSMVKMYQSRHPDINARAHATFGVLAALIALVVWGVLGGGALFWGVFTVLHVFTFLLLSLRIYYVGQFRLESGALAEAARGLRAGGGARPLYAPRLVALLLANAVNWAFALYGLFTMAADFAGHLLSVLLCNALLYMVFYLSMKLLHGERPRWYAWLFLAGAAAAWAPALYYFVSGSSDWAATPAASRHRNHRCFVLHFYDAHDLWHMLSAAALYLSFNAMLTWDDGLAAVKRTEIAVF